MFEYLMADIFLKSPKGTLLFNSSKNAAKVQKRTRCNGVFGLSESGYYRFDDGMKYQYQAFGVNALSLKSRSNECVISPYASFLAVKYLGGDAVKNLLRLKAMGMTGEYGYFESMDFSEKKPVASYMAHHQGMIMCSVANYLNDDILCSLFMRDKKNASGRHLLAEKKQREQADQIRQKKQFRSTRRALARSMLLREAATVSRLRDSFKRTLRACCRRLWAVVFRP
jgi:cyclic beta-1,2-glucan synthetase